MAEQYCRCSGDLWEGMGDDWLKVIMHLIRGSE